MQLVTYDQGQQYYTRTSTIVQSMAKAAWRARAANSSWLYLDSCRCRRMCRCSEMESQPDAFLVERSKKGAMYKQGSSVLPAGESWWRKVRLRADLLQSVVLVLGPLSFQFFNDGLEAREGSTAPRISSTRSSKLDLSFRIRWDLHCMDGVQHATLICEHDQNRYEMVPPSHTHQELLCTLGRPPEHK